MTRVAAVYARDIGPCPNGLPFDIPDDDRGPFGPLTVHSMKKAKRITNSAATIQVAA